MVKAAMRQANIKFTYNDYLQLPGDKRYELVEGDFRLVPAPCLYHQNILRKLGAAIATYAETRRLGLVFFAPCDLVLSEHNVVQPDLLMVPSERINILTDANIREVPELVVEILSPATAQRDLGVKRGLYARYGVREYWIVDPEARTAEVLAWSEEGYRTRAVILQDGLLNSELFPELNLPLTQIF